MSQVGPGVWPKAWELLGSSQSTRDTKNQEQPHFDMFTCAQIYNENNDYIIMYNRITAGSIYIFYIKQLHLYMVITLNRHLAYACLHMRVCTPSHVLYKYSHTPSIKERVPSPAALLSFATVQRGSAVKEEPAPSSQCLQQLQPSECGGHSACALGFPCCGAAVPIPHGLCEAVEFLLPVEQNGASVIRRFPSRACCAPQIGLFTSWKIK